MPKIITTRADFVAVRSFRFKELAYETRGPLTLDRARHIWVIATGYARNYYKSGKALSLPVWNS